MRLPRAGADVARVRFQWPRRLSGLQGSRLHPALPGLQPVEAFSGGVLFNEGARHQGAAEMVRYAARRMG
jgi:hypothetical protein